LSYKAAIQGAAAPAESSGATRAALLAMRAYRGTRSSNPLPSSRQSVSRGIFPSCIEKSAVAAVCAGPARRHGRQRRARLVKITPGTENISVGHYSSTAVPDRRFAIWLQRCAEEVGSPRDSAMVTGAEFGPLRLCQARCAARASQAADVNAPAVCQGSDRAADARRGWLR